MPKAAPLIVPRILCLTWLVLFTGAASGQVDSTACDAPSFDTANFDPYSMPHIIDYPDALTGSIRPSLSERIFDDHRNYYNIESFKLLTGGFLIGGAVANTQLDQEIQDHFQTSVRGATSDDWFEGLHGSKELGNGLYTLPVFAIAWAAGESFDESPTLVTTGRWGERSLRSFLVGAPPLILTQNLTGGSRPGERTRASYWRPFEDDNGVSGHAFMSSLPFINAAKMTDKPLLKTAFYSGSLIGPLSRINDDAHFTSQAALGWWMAFVAATAIDRTETASGNVQLYPYVTDDGDYGGVFAFRY